MSGIDRKKATKANSKVRIFCLFLAVIFVLSQASNIRIVSAAGKKIYVDKIAGNNTNSGKSPDSAVQSLRRAQKLLDGKGTIYVKLDGNWIALEEAKSIKKDKQADDVEQGKAEVLPETVEWKAPQATPEATHVEERVTEEETPIEETPIEEKKVSEEEMPIEEEKVTEEEAPKATLADAPEVAVESEETPVTEVIPVETPEDEKGDVASTPEVKNKENVDNSIEAPLTNNETSADVSEDTLSALDSEADSMGASETVTDDKDALEASVDAVPQAVTEEGSSEEAIPEETQEKIDDLTELVNQVTLMVEEQDDFENVVGATKAYEALNKEVKGKIPMELYKRLRASQIVVANSNRMSAGFSVAGDLPWYVEFRVVEKEGEGTFDFGETVGAYELTLWNTLTDEPYELDGREVTVTVPVDNATKYKNISVVHSLPDGGHEVLKVSRVAGENAISFATTSFSPYEIVGNTGDVYDQSGKPSSGGGTSSSGGSSNSGSSNSGSNGSSSSGNSSSNDSSDTKEGTNGQKATSARSTGVQTGDYNNIVMTVVIGALAGVLIAILIYFKNKRK